MTESDLSTPSMHSATQLRAGYADGTIDPVDATRAAR